MSTYTDASLIVTPNAKKAGKLYALKGADLTVVRATTATYVGADGLIKTALANEVRFDYTNGSCPSILVEPQRTNLVTYSEDFSNSNWLKNSITVTSNNAIAPDGTMTADKVDFMGTQSTAIEQFISYSVDNLTHTISCYVKTNSGTQNFHLKLTQAGVINYYSPTYTATTEWQRFTFTQAFGGGGGIGFYVAVISTGGTLNLWGAQLEQGSNATSCIPTTTTSVTRNADVISKTGLSGITSITETFENGTTNVISGSPTSYTMSQGRIKHVIGI